MAYGTAVRPDAGVTRKVTYPLRQGSVAERPNALALKASVGKTTGGSNPSASAAVQGRFPGWPGAAPDCFPYVGAEAAVRVTEASISSVTPSAAAVRSVVLNDARIRDNDPVVIDLRGTG